MRLLPQNLKKSESMSEWREVTLTEITSRIGDGLHGTPFYDDKGKYSFINGNNLSHGEIIIKADTKKVNEDEYLKYAKPLSNKTILLSINGTLGNLALYNNEKCILGKSACYININDENDRKFLYYVLLNKDFQTFIKETATGTTIPNVPLKGLREYTFNLPSLQEQKAIASVLSSLDDKIVLLHRQNKTLEAMAETLFRQWFVEETKEEWEEGVLSDFLTVRYGKDHKNLLDGVVPVIGSGGVMRYADTFLCNKESVLIPRKGSLNNVMYLDEPFWTVDTMFFTEMKKENSAKFIYFFIKEVDLASMNVGSAVPSMTTDLLNNMPLTIPPDALLEQFEDLIQPLFLKIKANRIQIRVLSTIRDTMLPKLMNGEVRVKL